jgi:hypothetical protein
MLSTVRSYIVITADILTNTKTQVEKQLLRIQFINFIFILSRLVN